MRWKCAWVCVTHTLAGEYVVERVGDGLWDVYFGPVLLGRMDERKLRIVDHRGRWIRRKVLPMSPDQSVTSLPDCSFANHSLGA